MQFVTNAELLSMRATLDDSLVDTCYIKRLFQTDDGRGGKRDTYFILGATERQQRITASGLITSGTFTLALNALPTFALNYNATRLDVWDKLVLLTNIGRGQVRTTGGPLPATPIDVYFTGSLSGVNAALMTVNNAGLVGGSLSVSSIANGALPAAFACRIAPSGSRSSVEQTGAGRVQSIYDAIITLAYDKTVYETDLIYWIEQARAFQVVKARPRSQAVSLRVEAKEVR